MNTRKKQREKFDRYSFSKRQVWNADQTMASFILPLLKEFKRMKRHGYPDCDENTNTPEKWEATLDRIIYTFDQLVHDFPDSPRSLARNKMEREHPECWDYKLTKDNPATYKMDFVHEDLHKQYLTNEINEKEKEYRAYIQEGLMLFSKYFQDLWD